MGTKQRIGMIGGGNMGAAILSGIVKEYECVVCEADSTRRRHLKRKFGVELVDLAELCRRSQVIILAVKPQSFDALLEHLKPHIRKTHLVVSIAAGITTLYIEKRLPQGARVVRTMPNLPAQVGRGVTGICTGRHASARDAGRVQRIFAKVGETVLVKEALMDAVTAVSGSGPAYLYKFMECWINSSERLGLPKEMSRAMVMETCAGALQLLAESGEDAATLREQVTSKGGTTAAALEVLVQSGLEKTVNQALKAARKRAKELSR